MKDFSDYILPHLRNLREPSAQAPSAGVRLDRNESPFNAPDNRYPEADLAELAYLWGRHEGIPPECVCFCHGTEEAVDLTLRLFCRPGQDSVAVPAPTRGVYGRRAWLYGVRCVRVELDEADGFALNAERMLSGAGQARVAFVCSPNNPTGRPVPLDTLERLLDEFDGMVVVDESYVDFAPAATALRLLNTHSNLVLFRSFSHAWASAGACAAAIVARPRLAALYRAVGHTHPLSTPCAAYLSVLFANRLDVDKWTRQVVEERGKVCAALSSLSVCERVYPSAANFLYVKVQSPARLHKYLLSEGVSVRLCQGGSVTEGFLRVTIGLPSENSRFVGAMRRFDA